MNRPTTFTAIPTRALKIEALANISASFELFCLASGMEALGEMMDDDARAICLVHAMREVMTGGRTAGGRREARSVFTAARSRSSGPGFAALRARSRPVSYTHLTLPTKRIV